MGGEGKGVLEGEAIYSVEHGQSLYNVSLSLTLFGSVLKGDDFTRYVA